MKQTNHKYVTKTERSRTTQPKGISAGRRNSTRHYRLGTSLFDLAFRALDERDVRRAVEPAARDLNAATGHTVHLASYEDGEVSYWTIRGSPRTRSPALARMRSLGYAVDNAEHEDFIHCVASPVRGARGEVLAALPVAVPTVVLDHDGLLELVQALRDAAEQASAECGWPVNHKES